MNLKIKIYAWKKINSKANKWMKWTYKWKKIKNLTIKKINKNKFTVLFPPEKWICEPLSWNYGAKQILKDNPTLEPYQW